MEGGNGKRPVVNNVRRVPVPGIQCSRGVEPGIRDGVNDWKVWEISRSIPSTVLPDGERKGYFGFIRNGSKHDVFFHGSDVLPIDPKDTRWNFKQGMEVYYRLDPEAPQPEILEVYCE